MHWLVGDVQGCARELDDLLKWVRFDPDRDSLVLLGDLINRGPESLRVLRHVHSMGPAVRIVLGNHDLHFLAIYFGGHTTSRSDTLDELLDAPDVDMLAHWLRMQPLMFVDNSIGWAMAHAGVPHIWSINQAQALA